MKKLTTRIMDDGDEKEISVFLDDETAKVLEECGDEELKRSCCCSGNNKKKQGSPSSGEPFCMPRRLFSAPSQTLFVCSFFIISNMLHLDNVFIL